MKLKLVILLLVSISSNSFALGDKEQNILATIGGLYLLGELIDNRVEKHHQNNVKSIEINQYEQHRRAHRQQHIQNESRNIYGQNSSICSDAVSCAYLKGFQDGIIRRPMRNSQSQYCSYYSGC